MYISQRFFVFVQLSLGHFILANTFSKNRVAGFIKSLTFIYINGLTCQILAGNQKCSSNGAHFDLISVNLFIRFFFSFLCC